MDSPREVSLESMLMQQSTARLLRIHDLEGEVAALKERLEADAKRLLFVREMVDGIGSIDLHEQASIYASALGREESNDDDYLAAIRDAIDAALARGGV